MQGKKQLSADVLETRHALALGCLLFSGVLRAVNSTARST